MDDSSVLSIINQVTGQGQASTAALPAVLSQAAQSGTSPDQEAQWQRLARESNVPVGLIRNGAPVKLMQLQQQGASLPATNPVTACTLMDPDNAAVAHDDIDTLTRLEDLARNGFGGQSNAPISTLQFGTPRDQAEANYFASEYGTKPFKAIQGGTGKLATKLAFPVAAAMDAVNGNDDYKEFASQLYDTFSRIQNESAADPSQTFGGKLVRSLEELAPMALSGGFGLGNIVGQAVNEKYDDLTAKGVDPDTATALALQAGMSSYAMMKLPFGGMSLSNSLARGAMFNPAFGALDRGLEKAGLNYAGYTKQADNIDLLDPETLAHDLAMGLMFGAQHAIQTGRPVMGDGLMESLLPFYDQYQAGHRADALTEIGNVVQDSKVNNRAPELVQQHLNDIAADHAGIDNAYIPVNRWNELFQSAGLDPGAVANEMLSNPEAYHEANKTGSDIVIPFGEFTGKLSGLDQYGELVKDARLSLGDTSLREAEAHVQALRDNAENGGGLIDTLKEMLSRSQEAVKGNESYHKIYDDLVGQQLGIGTERGTAERNAQLVANAFRVMGDRAGVDPFELYSHYNLKLARPMDKALTDRISIDTSIDPMLERLRAGDVPKESDMYGPSLLDTLRESGLKDSGGELANMDIDADRKPFQRKIVRDDGMELDKAREMLVGRGYLPEGSTINDLLDAIDTEMRGGRVASDQYRNAKLMDEHLALIQLQDHLDRMGIDPRNMSNAEIRKAMSVPMEGEGFDQAVNAQNDPNILYQSAINHLAADGVAKSYIYGYNNDKSTFAERLNVPETYQRDFERAGEVDVSSYGIPLTEADAQKAKQEGFAAYQIRPAAVGGDVAPVELKYPYRLIVAPGILRGETSPKLTSRQQTFHDAMKLQARRDSRLKDAFSKSENTPYFQDSGATKEPYQNKSQVLDKSAKKGIIASEGGVTYVADKVSDYNRNTDHPAEATTEKLAGDVDGSRPLSGSAYEQLALFTPEGEKRPEITSTSASEAGTDNVKKVVTGVLHSAITKIKSPADAAHIAIPLTKRAQEAAIAIVTDAKGKVLGVIQHTTGTLDQSLINPRDLLGVVHDFPGAAEVWFAHNHPSGDPVLSSADKSITARLSTALDGSAIRSRGMIAVGQDGGAFWTDGIASEHIPLEALNNGKERTRGIKTYDREIVKLSSSERLSNPRMVAEYAKTLGPDASGIIILDTKLRPVSFVNMSLDEMAKLKTGDPDSGSSAIMSAFHKANGSSMVVIAPEIENYSRAMWNMVSFGKVLNAKVIDAIETNSGRSLVESGLMPEGTDRFNQGNDSKRGYIRFDNNRNFEIGLLKDANLSTFIHESGHFFTEVLGDLAALPDAPQQVKDDYAALLKFAGVDSRDAIRTEHHERLARAFESYIMEGKAPSVEMHGMFQRMKAWMIGVYKDLTALNVKLTPEVRAVFDRMLATDSEIGRMRDLEAMKPLFATAEDAGMSQAEFALYRKDAEQAGEQAKEQLLRRLLAEKDREQKTWWKDERKKTWAEVEAEAKADPIYQAYQALTTGKTFDGRDVGDIKLSRADLVKQYGEAFVKTLPREFRRIYGKEGGLHPDAMAEMAGFGSGDEMVRKMAGAPKLKEYIKAETDRRMRERYGDMMTDGSIHEQALHAVHNDAQGKVMRAELLAIQRKAREVKPFVDAAKREGKADAEATARWYTAEGRSQDDRYRKERDAMLGAIPPIEFFKLTAAETMGLKRVLRFSRTSMPTRPGRRPVNPSKRPQ